MITGKDPMAQRKFFPGSASQAAIRSSTTPLQKVVITSSDARFCTPWEDDDFDEDVYNLCTMVSVCLSCLFSPCSCRRMMCYISRCVSELLLVGTQGSSWFLVVSGWFSQFLLGFMFLYVYLFGFHCSSLFFGWFYLVSWLFIGFSFLFLRQRFILIAFLSTVANISVNYESNKLFCLFTRLNSNILLRSYGNFSSCNLLLLCSEVKLR